VTEWFSRWTRNPRGSARRGLNPLAVARFASNIASISLGDLCSGSYALARAGKKSVSGQITLRFMFMAFLTEI